VGQSVHVILMLVFGVGFLYVFLVFYETVISRPARLGRAAWARSSIHWKGEMVSFSYVFSVLFYLTLHAGSLWSILYLDVCTDIGASHTVVKTRENAQSQ